MAHRITYQSARSPLFTLALLGVSTLCSCSDKPENKQDSPRKEIEITSQGAALTAIENTENALKGVVDSGEFLAESTSLAETLNALAGKSGSCSTTEANGCDSGSPDCVVDTTCTSDGITAEDLQKVRDDMREELDELVKRLREEIFIEANLDAEGTTETQVTYRLGPDVLCKDSDPPPPVPGAAPSEAPALDPDCVADAEKANLRVRLSQPTTQDVDVTFIVTNDNLEPLTLQLYKDRVGAKVDLGQGLKALEALGKNAESIDNLEGVVQLQLLKNATLNYSLQGSILEDLDVSLSSNGEAFSYSVAKSVPLSDINIDGNAKTITATYYYGAIQVLAPLRALASFFGDDGPTTNDDLLPVPEKTYTGVVEVLIPGITGKFTYTADSDTFSFSDMSLGNGTSTLKHNGNALASVDLNPKDGRGFDLTLRATTDDQGNSSALVSLDPTIDLNIAVQFENVADQITSIPESLLNDKLRLWFEGDEPTFSVEDDQMRMVSGSFHLSSERSPQSNVDVPEGMCLFSADADVSPSDEPVEDETSSLFAVKVAICQ